MCSLAWGSECWREGLRFGFVLCLCLQVLRVSYVLAAELIELLQAE